MHFMASNDAKRLAKKLRRQIDEQGQPRLVLYYRSGDRDYRDASQAIIATLGKFTQATLCFLFCVTGDGWNEDLATHEGWMRYREWRAAHGENRRLSEAPGHRFESHEAEHLSKAVAFALQLGWDALLAAKPDRRLLLLSHDDRVEVYRGSASRLLAEKLIALRTLASRAAPGEVTVTSCAGARVMDKDEGTP